MLSKLLYRAAVVVALFSFWNCGGGDDDGRRLGDYIVGNWQRGWGKGDVIIEGDTDFQPEDFSYDLFVFKGDGTYNGMVRDGSFTTIDEFGDVIYEGRFRCDNNNLKMEFTDEEGRKQTLLAQVLAFTEDTLKIRYENEEYNVAVTMILRKGQSSSSASEM